MHVYSPESVFFICFPRPRELFIYLQITGEIKHSQYCEISHTMIGIFCKKEVSMQKICQKMPRFSLTVRRKRYGNNQ